MGTTLIVMRHLKTSDSLEQRFCSGERDIPLLPGQTIPAKVIEEIQGVKENHALAHTRLKRTQETAILLAQALGVSRKMLVFPEFRERQGGQLAGLEFKEIQQFFSQLQEPKDLWAIEAPNLGLESATNFLLRIERGLMEVRAVSITVVLVAHAGSIKGIRAVMETEGLESRKQVLCTSTPEPGECFKFYI